MIIVDVETTGLFPEKYAMIDIGAVDFYDPLRTFSMPVRAWDGCEFSKFALEVNGYTEEELKDHSRPPLEEAIGAFIEWSEGCASTTLAGQNPEFDSKFLKHGFSTYRDKKEWPFSRRVVDMHSITYAHMLSRGILPPMKNRGSALSGDEIMKYVNVPQEPKPHRHGLTGALYECEAFSRLVCGKNLLSEFSKHKIPEYLKK